MERVKTEEYFPMVHTWEFLTDGTLQYMYFDRPRMLIHFTWVELSK